VWSPSDDRLERLFGDRSGQHSIRWNDQFRIRFIWRDGNAEAVEITDYHRAKTTMIRRDDLSTLVSDKPASPPLITGKVLPEEFMRPAALTARASASDLGVPGNRISAILNGTRGITAATAWLGCRFGTSAELWMNLQTAHDLSAARERMRALAA
jgi:addiction module HigA family antidote